MAITHSPFASARTLAIAVIFAVSAGIAATGELILGAARWCRSTFERIVLAAPQPIQAGQVPTSRPERALAQAKAFVLRFVKRDRPVRFRQWCMCPSI